MPLEQIGNALTFEAYYTDGGNVATGLTVTVDVWELTAGGVATEIVAGGGATEMGDGLYYYQLAAVAVDAKAIYTAVFKTADPCDQQDIAAGWVVGPTWVENVDVASSTLATAAALAVAQADLDNPTQYWADLTGIPLAVWSHTPRTLTQSAASIIAAVEGSVVAVYQFNTWAFSLTGLGSLAGRAALYFTAKENIERADGSQQTILQVEETAGLIWIGGDAAANPLLGTLVVDDAVAGDITVTVDETVTGIPSVDGRYDVKLITAAGVARILTISVFEVYEAVTRAVT